MERWAGKVALVTGASAGIGAAITEELVRRGLKVIGLARRVDRIEALKTKLKGEKGELFPLKGDVGVIEDINKTFKWISDKFGAIHVLVNNAGIVRNGSVRDGDLDDFLQVFNVNLVGATACSKRALELMKKAGVDDGHIININSIAGHKVLSNLAPVNIYAASKHGITALTEILRQELTVMKSKIRVTSISPGVVETEIAQASATAAGQSKEQSEEMAKLMASLPSLKPEDIAASVIYVLSAPPHVAVHELLIKPVGEPF